MKTTKCIRLYNYEECSRTDVNKVNFQQNNQSDKSISVPDVNFCNKFFVEFKKFHKLYECFIYTTQTTETLFYLLK